MKQKTILYVYIAIIFLLGFALALVASKFLIPYSYIITLDEIGLTIAGISIAVFFTFYRKISDFETRLKAGD